MQLRKHLLNENQGKEILSSKGHMEDEAQTTEQKPVQRNWSDKKNWWMDLLKSVLTFALVTIITVLILESRQERRSAEQYRNQTILQLRISKLEQFKNASIRYQSDILMYRDYLSLRILIETPNPSSPTLSTMPDPRDAIGAEQFLINEFQDDPELKNLSTQYLSAIQEQRKLVFEVSKAIFFQPSNTYSEVVDVRGKLDRYAEAVAQAQKNISDRYERLVFNTSGKAL